MRIAAITLAVALVAAPMARAAEAGTEAPVSAAGIPAVRGTRWGMTIAEARRVLPALSKVEAPGSATLVDYVDGMRFRYAFGFCTDRLVSVQLRLQEPDYTISEFFGAYITLASLLTEKYGPSDGEKVSVTSGCPGESIDKIAQGCARLAQAWSVRGTTIDLAIFGEQNHTIVVLNYRRADISQILETCDRSADLAKL